MADEAIQRPHEWNLLEWLYHVCGSYATVRETPDRREKRGGGDERDGHGGASTLSQQEYADKNEDGGKIIAQFYRLADNEDADQERHHRRDVTD